MIACTEIRFVIFSVEKFGVNPGFFFFFFTHILFNNPHSKNTRVSVTRKRVLWGQIPFRVKDDPEIGQTCQIMGPD